MAGPLRLVFLGSDPIALPLLNWMAGEGSVAAKVIGVFTNPDRASGRGQQVQPGAIAAWAAAHSIPAFQPAKLDAAATSALASLEADLALVVAYGHILREVFIETPRLGTLNLHASLLPAYRGASPIQTAIAMGDRQTGLSLMRIVAELDAGPVADTETVGIGPGDTAIDVEAKLASAAIPLVSRGLPALARGELPFVEQDRTRVSYCRRLGKTDRALDFAAPAAVLAARINGLYPWPAVTIPVLGLGVRLGLALASPQISGAEPGTVLGLDGTALAVATGAGTLRILRLQRPGGRMLVAGEFLRGFPVAPGTVLSSTPMPPLAGPVPFPRV